MKRFRISLASIFLLAMASESRATLLGIYPPVVNPPAVSFRDNSDGSVTLQVTPGSFDLGFLSSALAQVSVVTSDVTLSGVALADETVWVLPAEGLNPVTRDVTIGLDLSRIDQQEIYISYLSRKLDAEERLGPLDILTIFYEGAGEIRAEWYVADGAVDDSPYVPYLVEYGSAWGESNRVIGIPEPAGALLAAIGLAVFADRRHAI